MDNCPVTTTHNLGIMEREGGADGGRIGGCSAGFFVLGEEGVGCLNFGHFFCDNHRVTLADLLSSQSLKLRLELDLYF